MNNTRRELGQVYKFLKYIYYRRTSAGKIGNKNEKADEGRRNRTKRKEIQKKKRSKEEKADKRRRWNRKKIEDEARR
jgi:hypothetical protein